MRFFVVLLLIVGWSYSSVAQDFSSIEKVMDEAQKGNYTEAEQMAEAFKSDPKTYAYVQGELNLFKGRTEDAMENFEESLALLKGSKTELEVHCLSRMGIAYWNTGNIQMGVRFLEESLALATKVAGYESELVAGVLNDLGLVYSISDPDKSLDYYLRARKLYETVLTEDKDRLATSLINTGLAQVSLEYYGDAINDLEAAEEILIGLHGPNHPRIAFVKASLGKVGTAMRQYDNAIAFYNQALDIFKRNYGEKHPEIANLHNQIAGLLLKKELYTEALQELELAFIANLLDYSIANPEVNPAISSYLSADILLASLSLKARVLESRYFGHSLKDSDLRLGLDCITQCSGLIDKIRQTRIQESDKIALGKISDEIYATGVSISAMLGNFAIRGRAAYRAKAFEFSEKNKSAVLLASISDSNAKSFAGIPDAVLTEEKELKNNISLLEHQLLQKNDPALKTQLFNAQRTYNALIEKMEKDFPKYYQLKYNTNIPSVSSLQNELSDEEAILSFFVDDNRNKIYHFVITKNKMDLSWGSKPETFEHHINGFRNAIIYEVDDVFLTSSHALYQALFRGKIPRQIKKLIIIPTGQLGTIPFEALIEKLPKEEIDYGALDYLVKRYSIAYQYSSTLLFQDKGKEFGNEVSLLAPVQFGYENGEYLSDLPGSLDEVESINSIFNAAGYTVSSFVEAQASESVLKSGKHNSCRVLHLATHGIVDEDNPSMSRIFLANAKEEDGFLYSSEIYNLKFRTDLIALSACQTGLGKVTKGEGIMGLTRAFLYAGANQLLVSLWTVNDEATSKLMTNFYANTVQNQFKYAEALREAKLSAIHNQKFNKPRFWAAFVLIGE